MSMYTPEENLKYLFLRKASYLILKQPQVSKPQESSCLPSTQHWDYCHSQLYNFLLCICVEA